MWSWLLSNSNYLLSIVITLHQHVTWFNISNKIHAVSNSSPVELIRILLSFCIKSLTGSKRLQYTHRCYHKSLKNTLNKFIQFWVKCIAADALVPLHLSICSYWLHWYIKINKYAYKADIRVKRNTYLQYLQYGCLHDAYWYELSWKHWEEMHNGVAIEGVPAMGFWRDVHKSICIIAIHITIIHCLCRFTFIYYLIFLHRTHSYRNDVYDKMNLIQVITKISS